MNLPSDTPKLPKWIFLLGDAALLATAWYIADSAAHPTTGVALISIVACVAVASVLGAIPFVTDYARRQDEALDNRQRALQALSVTVAAAAEQVSIAATGLNGIAEAAQDNFSKSERLAQQIQEKMAELDARLAAARKGDAEAAAKLESVAKAIAEVDARIAAAKKEDAEVAAKLEAFAKKMGKSVAELEAAVSKAAEAARAVPAPPVHIPELPPVIASKMVEIKPAVAASNPPYVAPAEPAAPAAAPVPHVIPEPAAETPPSPDSAPAVAPEPAAASADPAPAPAAPPPRKRAPRKPAPAPAAEPPAEAVAAPVAEHPSEDLILESPAADDPQSTSFVEISEPSISADGATRLLVTAYIGIGNRLFVRGDGPGLTWEKGVPLTFVSIGKWRWETNDASKAVAFRLYKNDEVECTALGKRSVEPGAQLELTASF